MTKSWAAEFGPRGVRVNAVSPGPTRTPGTEMMGDALDQLAAQSPAGYAAPEDIAAVITFLAGDDARYVQGALVGRGRRPDRRLGQQPAGLETAGREDR
jgi:NAD(P)-dependent dehydrogenase (short-subunit alcohol dehydrogenase family)